MSSLVRTIEKRIMKRAGYTRENWILVKDKSGDLIPQTVKRDGEITDPDDNPIGRDWPARIPMRAKMHTQVQPRNDTVRALRKPKPNKRMVARRAARAEQSA